MIFSLVQRYSYTESYPMYLQDAHVKCRVGLWEKPLPLLKFVAWHCHQFFVLLYVAHFEEVFFTQLSVVVMMRHYTDS